MKTKITGWALVLVSGLGALALSCGGGSDDSPASAGSSSGGSPSAAGGSSSAGRSGASNAGSAGNSGASVDCAAVCGHVKALCSENSAISDVWVDACKSACDARVQVAPDTAQLEQTCVMSAADCSASIVCVASPH